MKRKLLLILLPLLLVTSCGQTATSNDSSSSENTNVATEFSQEMIDMLASGYAQTGIFSMGGQSYGGFYNQYVETHCTTDVFEYKAWTQSLIGQEATKDKLQYDIRYEPALQGGSKYLAETELTLANELTHYIVQYDSGRNVPWAQAGYSNSFSLFKSTDFVKTENPNEFSLLTTNDSFKNIYVGIATQMSGMMGLDIETFTIQTDGVKPVSYKLICKNLDTKYGDVIESFIEGRFLGFGANVVKDMKPVEGEKDEFFEQKMTALCESKNWIMDAVLIKEDYQILNYNDQALIYEAYDKAGNKTGSYGYAQLDETTVQGVTRINGTLYLDGGELGGSVSMILPKLKISSVFFEENEESTETKKIYTLKPEYKDIASGTDYGMFGGSLVGDLTVIFENNEVTFINKLELVEEKFTYSSIGEVDNLLEGLQRNCDSLTWSKLASNQPAELASLEQVVPLDLLDQIPTIGGTYSYITLDATYNPNRPVFTVPIDDYATGETLYEGLSEKLIVAGFTKVDEQKTSTGNKFVYQKECIVEEETKILQAEIYLVFDIYSMATRFLLYPSII